MSHARMRKLVVQHFQGKITPQEERQMRLHLPTCESCTKEYEKQLTFSEMAKFGSAQQRLGRGLGIDLPRQPLFKPIWITSGATLAVGFAALLFLLSPRLLERGEFQSRGSKDVLTQNEILIYSVDAHGKWTQVSDSLLATGELGFAYRNPQHFGQLLIYGQDEHGHIYWYQPVWTGHETAPPSSVAIVDGADVHELAHVVSHDLDGQKLTITAAFANTPAAVTTIEERLKHQQSPVDSGLVLSKQFAVKR